MIQDTRVAVIGCGTIGSMVARLIVASSLTSAERIHLTRRNTDLLAEMSHQGYIVSDDNERAVSDADLIIISLEPEHVVDVVHGIRGSLDPDNQIMISVAAGVSTDRIERAIGKPAEIVRAMPNTALRVGEAITALSTNRPRGEGIGIARRLFASGGATIDVAEHQLHAVTALGGSGPAFFLTAIAAAIEGGMMAGLDQDQARAITVQAIRGAVGLISDAATTPEEEIARIVTPNGCTAVGLETLKTTRLEAAFSSAVIAAANRAAELGGDTPANREST